MNALHWIIYLLRLPLYLAALVLFRCYLVLIFLTRSAAPWIVTAVFAAVAYWGRDWIEPKVRAIHADWMWNHSISTWQYRVANVAEPNPYLFGAIIGGIALFLALWWLQAPLRYVLLAFPMPQRPMPPLRHWTPPVHRLKAYPVFHALPKLPLRFADGRMEAYIARLDPKLRALTQPKAPLAPVKASQKPKAGQGAPVPASAPQQAPAVPQAPAAPATKPKRPRKASTNQPAPPPMPLRRGGPGPMAAE